MRDVPPRVSPLLSLLINCPVPMCRRPVGTIRRIVIADRSAQALQPKARPGEFKAQYSKPYRYHNYCGARRHQHDDSNRKYRATDHRDSNSARDFVCQLDCIPDHQYPPNAKQPGKPGSGSRHCLRLTDTQMYLLFDCLVVAFVACVLHIF